MPLRVWLIDYRRHHKPLALTWTWYDNAQNIIWRLVLPEIRDVIRRDQPLAFFELDITNRSVVKTGNRLFKTIWELGICNKPITIHPPIQRFIWPSEHSGMIACFNLVIVSLNFISTCKGVTSRPNLLSWTQHHKLIFPSIMRSAWNQRWTTLKEIK